MPLSFEPSLTQFRNAARDCAREPDRTARRLDPTDRRRIRAIYRAARTASAALAPPARADPLEELMLTVLSQHTSDLNAERAFADLQRAFPTWWQRSWAPERSRWPTRSARGGLANTKAPRIQAILREVRDREGAFDLSLDARCAIARPATT